MGLKYQKLAVSSVRLKELITSSGCKVHGKAMLTGVDNMQECVNVGIVEYWMRLKLPISQAVRLYQVHVHCLGYNTCSAPPPPKQVYGQKTKPIFK